LVNKRFRRANKVKLSSFNYEDCLDINLLNNLNEISNMYEVSDSIYVVGYRKRWNRDILLCVLSKAHDYISSYWASNECAKKAYRKYYHKYHRYWKYYYK
jgi:hypothetical protein